MAITQISKTNWKVDFSIYPNGKQKRIRKEGFRTKKNAEKYIASRKPLNGGSLVDENFNTMTFGELANIYLSKHLTKTKAAGNGSYIKKLIDTWGDITIGAINTADTTAWVMDMLAGDEYQIATVKNYLTYFKAVINYGVKMEIISRNPIAHVKFQKEFARATTRNYTMSVDEFQEFLTCFNDSPSYVSQIITILYFTGWRVGEILSLKWEEIDFKNGHITKAASDTKEAKERIGGMEKEVSEILLQRKKERIGNTTYVFELTKMKSISYQTYYKYYKEAIKGSKWESFVTHDQRHSYTKRKRLEGADREVIKTQQGHSTNSMFERYNDIDLQELSEMSGFSKVHQEIIESEVAELVQLMKSNGIAPNTLFTLFRSIWTNN